MPPSHCLGWATKMKPDGQSKLISKLNLWAKCKKKQQVFHTKYQWFAILEMAPSNHFSQWKVPTMLSLTTGAWHSGFLENIVKSSMMKAFWIIKPIVAVFTTAPVIML